MPIINDSKLIHELLSHNGHCQEEGRTYYSIFSENETFIVTASLNDEICYLIRPDADGPRRLWSQRTGLTPAGKKFLEES